VGKTGCCPKSSAPRQGGSSAAPCWVLCCPHPPTHPPHMAYVVSGRRVSPQLYIFMEVLRANEGGRLHSAALEALRDLDVNGTMFLRGTRKPYAMDRLDRLFGVFQVIDVLKLMDESILCPSLLRRFVNSIESRYVNVDFATCAFAEALLRDDAKLTLRERYDQLRGGLRGRVATAQEIVAHATTTRRAGLGVRREERSRTPLRRRRASGCQELRTHMERLAMLLHDDLALETRASNGRTDILRDETMELSKIDEWLARYLKSEVVPRLQSLGADPLAKKLLQPEVGARKRVRECAAALEGLRLQVDDDGDDAMMTVLEARILSEYVIGPMVSSIEHEVAEGESDGPLRQRQDVASPSGCSSFDERHDVQSDASSA
jgi:hypothetical protein